LRTVATPSVVDQLDGVIGDAGGAQVHYGRRGGISRQGVDCRGYAVALLSVAVNVCVVLPIVRVYCVGLPEGSGVESHVPAVWLTAEPAAAGVFLLLQTVSRGVQQVHGRDPCTGTLQLDALVRTGGSALVHDGSLDRVPGDCINGSRHLGCAIIGRTDGEIGSVHGRV